MTQPALHLLKPRNTVAFFATVALMVGLYTGNPSLVFLGTACITAVVLAYRQARGLLAEVSGDRTHLPRAFQNGAVAIALSLRTGKRAGPEFLLAEDYCPPAAASKIRRLIPAPLMPDVAQEIHYIATCDHRRGIYVLGPVRLEAFDALGFFRCEVSLELYTDLLVYPLAVDLDNFDVLADGTVAHVGLETTRRLGVSEEFVGIREYRQGDSPRYVHWRSTARHNRLMVKEFQEERTTLVTLMVDLGQLGLVGVGDHTSVEYGIKAAASIARRTAKRGHRLQYFGISEKVDHVPAGQGTGHLLAILDRLAFARAEGKSAFAIVSRDLSRNLPRGSTMVLFTGAAAAELDALSAVVAEATVRRILPIVVLIDDRAFIKILREQETLHANAAPLEEIARSLRLQGARVYVIRRSRTLEEALEQGLSLEANL